MQYTISVRAASVPGGAPCYTAAMRSAPSFLVFSAITLILHGLWERTHIVLYTGYGAMEGALPAWLFATLGDLLYTFLIILFISAAKGGFGWIKRASMTDLLAAALLGALVALMVEYKGLYLGRWEYLPSMPIIPLLGIGLSPILQMTLITPMSLLITKHLFNRT